MKIKIEKLLRITLNGMSFRFMESPASGKACLQCPIFGLCERLPNPEKPRDKEQRFLDFCGMNENINEFFGGAEYIPDMTEGEIKEVFMNVGYELYDKLPVV